MYFVRIFRHYFANDWSFCNELRRMLDCVHGLIYTCTGSPVINNYFVFVLCVICPFWFHSVHFSAHVTCTVQSRLSDYHVVLYYRKSLHITTEM